MAYIKKISDNIDGLSPDDGKTISGTIKRDNSGVARRVLLFRNNETAAEQETYSGGSGAYSFTTVANANDRFTVIAVGLDGEHSQIHNNITIS